MITHLERKRRTTSRSSFSRRVAVSDVVLCRARSFAGADDVATPCLPCWDVPCSLWAVDGCSAWWFVERCRGKVDYICVTCDIGTSAFVHNYVLYMYISHLQTPHMSPGTSLTHHSHIYFSKFPQFDTHRSCTDR